MKLFPEKLLTALISTATVALFSTTLVTGKANPTQAQEWVGNSATLIEQLEKIVAPRS